MYYEYFGLKQPPFKNTPDTSLFFPGGNRGAVLEALIYAITEGEGIVKVVGEVGSGKTMLCRMLEIELPENVEVVYLANPSLSPEDTLYAIAFELKLDVTETDDRLKVMNELQNYLLDRHADNRQIVVFVEEAQGMPIATLEEIRLLSNLETTQNKLLQIVLFGQPELDEKIATREIRQLKERITYSFHLAPFKANDVKDYLNSRMWTCGYRSGDVFSSSAVSAIAKYSKGLLRRINILADKSLLAAYAGNTYKVSASHVKTAARDSEFIKNRTFLTPVTVSMVVILFLVLTGGLIFPAKISQGLQGIQLSLDADTKSFDTQIDSGQIDTGISLGLQAIQLSLDAYTKPVDTQIDSVAENSPEEEQIETIYLPGDGEVMSVSTEAQIKKAKEQIEKQANESRRELAEAKNLKSSVEEDRKKLERDAEEQREEQAALEKSVKEKAKALLEQERRKLADKVAQNNEELEQAQKEKAVAEAGRVAAKEEADKMIEEYKAKFEKEKAELQVQFKAERSKLEEEAQQIGKKLDEVHKARDDAEAASKLAEKEASKLKVKQAKKIEKEVISVSTEAEVDSQSLGLNMSDKDISELARLNRDNEIGSLSESKKLIEDGGSAKTNELSENEDVLLLPSKPVAIGMTEQEFERFKQQLVKLPPEVKLEDTSGVVCEKCASIIYRPIL